MTRDENFYNPGNYGQPSQPQQPYGMNVPQYGQYPQQSQYQWHQGYNQQSTHPAVFYEERPPRSARVQRVLLWVLAVVNLLAVALLTMTAGGLEEAAFEIGYNFLHIVFGAVLIALALNFKRGARWVRISTIVFHSVLMFFQVLSFLGGNILALLGFLASVFGLILANRASSREFFRKTPRIA